METFLDFKVSISNYFLQTIGIIVTFAKKYIYVTFSTFSYIAN